MNLRTLNNELKRAEERKKIYEYLCSKSGTVREVADRVKICENVVRNHLYDLEKQGYLFCYRRNPAAFEVVGRSR